MSKRRVERYEIRVDNRRRTRLKNNLRPKAVIDAHRHSSLDTADYVFTLFVIAVAAVITWGIVNFILSSK